MNIIEVIPIGRGISTDTLSYFTSQELAPGVIVDVPLRSKSVRGIVVSSTKASDMKGDIKRAKYALKKVEKIKSAGFFSDAFMRAVETEATYYASSVGSVLDAVVPDYILSVIGKLKGVKEKVAPASHSEKYAVQGNDEERYGTWKSLIRQEFAHKRSVFLLLPTIEDAERAFELLEKGIEGYAFLLHGGLTSKQIVERWNTIMKETHPVAIVATGGFLSLPRPDISTLVVERESNRSYKIMRRPYLDLRHVAETLAEAKGMKFFLSDSFLQTETLWREHEGELTQASPFKVRSLSTATDTLVDMRRYKATVTGFRVFSDEVEDLLRKNKEESEHLVILTARRGVAPSVVCSDCQNIVLCRQCSSPVVLHTTSEGKGFFLCHRCGERRSAEEYCATCGSWKLGLVGIGTDIVVQTIKDLFPDMAVWKIDADAAKGAKDARTIAAKWRAQPGSVLVGTEMMLPYIQGTVENAAVVTIDSLLSLPDFRIQERLLYLLVRMRSLATARFVVQTRKPEEKVFEYGLKGNMSDFYRTSIAEREKFNYPPFTTLIKLTLEGKKDAIVKAMEEAQNILDPYEVEIFPAFTHTIRGNFILHGLIRLPRASWPDTTLREKIRELSPAVSVKVDPDSLL